MIDIKLHKWLFSLTLLISLTSFSGVLHQQVKPVNTITKVVEHNNAPTSTYYVSLAKQNLALVLITYYSFNFKKFIQTQNSLFTQKEKAQKLAVFTFKDVFFNTTHLKRASVTNTEDLYTFIG